MIMKLNTEIYNSVINAIQDIKTTDLVRNLVKDGKLKINTEIDPSIFYTVNMETKNQYIVLNTKTGKYDRCELKGQSGLILGFRTNYKDYDNPYPVFPIYDREYNSRLAYDVAQFDENLQFENSIITEITFSKLMYVVQVCCARFTYNDNKEVTEITNYEYIDWNTYKVLGLDKPIINLRLMPYYGNIPRTGYSLELMKPFQVGTLTSPKDYSDVYFPYHCGSSNSCVLCVPIFGFDQSAAFQYDKIAIQLGRMTSSISGGAIDLPWRMVKANMFNRHFEFPVFNGNDDTVIELFKQFGVPFTFDEEIAKNGKMTDDGVYMPVIDDDGKLTGDTTTGDENVDSPQPTWDTPTDWQNNNFNGFNNTDPNNYTDNITLSNPTLSNVNVFNRSFAVTSNNVRQLADFLWNADETKFNEIVKGLALMGENPMNGIIDLRLFPFNVALKNSATQAEPIVIGRTNTGINGIKLTENVNSLIDLGECTFFTKFKNFLDYEPYTTAQLYIPYIGVVPVSTAEFMGHRISVKMIVDYTTGAGTAIVFKDDIPFIYRNGVVGVSIPMTGNDSASYANTVIGNVVSGAVGGVASIASGNIGGMVSSVEKLYSGFATGTNYQEASASSPSVATWQPQKCYFIIDRPILNVPDNYGRTIGFACEKTGKLSDFKGFTVVSNPEINFRCTDSERQYIVNMLQGGVFV